MKSKKESIQVKKTRNLPYFRVGRGNESIQKGKAADSIGKMSRLRREIAYRRIIVFLWANDRLPGGEWSSA